ncbi:hypothetical protein [Nostoc sp. LEGE 12450]|uniref:hypothetical protein n=1 Tax=Nostoc sp. LEGE 12450 TaxID=1828643 RepID=UPI0018801746|nr:hypothetical protein [Nostoc sp. LEGE 12450]MBE8986094.1 hypothetical protein [Nostoc sp. LEGE 12450]
MESQTVQPTVIDAQILQQIQDEIQQEMREIIKNSNLNNVLEKYGISGENILEVHCTVNLDKIQNSHIVDKQRVQNFAVAIPHNKIALKGCIITNQGMICG